MCVSARTHGGLVVLLEDSRDFACLCVVSYQWRAGGWPASGLLGALHRGRSANSSFAARTPAADRPVRGTGPTGQLSAAVRTQWRQSEQVGPVRAVQVVASR